MNWFFSTFLSPENIKEVPIVFVLRGVRPALFFFTSSLLLFAIGVFFQPQWLILFSGIAICCLLLTGYCFWVKRLIIIDKSHVYVITQYFITKWIWSESLLHYTHLLYVVRRKRFQADRSPWNTHASYIYLTHQDTSQSILLYRENGDVNTRIVLTWLSDLLKIPIMEEIQGGIISYFTDMPDRISVLAQKDHTPNLYEASEPPKEITTIENADITEIHLPNTIFWYENQEAILSCCGVILLLSIILIMSEGNMDLQTWLILGFFFIMLILEGKKLFFSWSKKTIILRISKNETQVLVHDLFGREEFLYAIQHSEILHIKKESNQSHYKNSLTIITQDCGHHIGFNLNPVSLDYLHSQVLQAIARHTN